MRSYNCDECKSSFATLGELMTHRTATGHLLACPKCYKTFVQKNLTKHIKRHYDEHNCSECSKVFNTKANLARHTSSQHGAGKRKLLEEEQSAKKFKADDPKLYYDMQKIREQRFRKFNTTGTTYHVTFQDVEDEGLPKTLKALKIIFQSILDDLSEKTSANDLIRISIQNPEFDYPIELPFKQKRLLNADSILYEIERVLQSYQEFKLDSGLKLDIIHVSMPAGRGRYKMNYVNVERALREKHCFIQIRNTDDICCARAIVTAIARVEKHPKWESIRKGRKIQQQLALELHEKANIPVAECGIDEIKRFQAVLPGYQVHVYSLESACITFKGPPADQKIFLFNHNNHFDVITSMPAFLGNGYYCDTCEKGYNTKEHHACNNPCFRCKGIHKESGTAMKCDDCLRWFDGEKCFDMHKKTTSSGRSTCNSVYICENCNHTVNNDWHKDKNPHRCGNVYCKVCRNWYPTNHQCYMKVDQSSTKESNDLEELLCDDRTPSEEEQMKTEKYIYFDFECRQEKMIQCSHGYHPHIDSRLCQNCKKSTCGTLKHEPNLCVAHRVCSECSEAPVTPSSTCQICGTQEHIFFGDSARDDFCSWLFSGENNGSIVLAHNFRGYDSLPILEYLHKNGIVPEIISQGSKNLSVTVSQCKIKMIDSLSFLNNRLANLPKMFGMTELKKGYYPHLWNTKENEDKVLDCLPDVKYYNCESMKDDDRRVFQKWYEEHKHDRFDSKEELIAYCRSDVDILRRCCTKVQKMFMQLTSETNDEGIDPFKSCITIASACMKAYRRKFLKPNTIALIPLKGYGGRDKQSFKAMQWIKYVSENEGRDIQHALNCGEAHVGQLKIDGCYQSKDSKVAMEFLGCFWHGCPKCFSRTTVNPINGKTMETLHNEVLDRELALKKEGLQTRFMWECDWEQMIKDQDQIQNFVENLHIVPPLEPRDAFFGGRTEAFTLYADASAAKNIKYYDVTSLYPYINKTGKYVVGHPVVTTENFTELETYEGLVKCKVVPPKELFLPVLPQKINNKLIFALCRTCASKQQQENCSHTDEERALIGTWVTDELKKAVQKGYKVVQIFEVWHWNTVEQYDPKTKTGGLFTEYVNTFLKVTKQQVYTYELRPCLNSKFTIQ